MITKLGGLKNHLLTGEILGNGRAIGVNGRQQKIGVAADELRSYHKAVLVFWKTFVSKPIPIASMYDI